MDRGPEAEEWLTGQFGQTLVNMIAQAATDKDAARLLKKIAARAVEADFG
jgi:hypothetical protein